MSITFTTDALLDSETLMAYASIGSADDNTELVSSAVLMSDEDALAAFAEANAGDSSVRDYTDGYAIAFQQTRGTALFTFDENPYGVCVAGTVTEDDSIAASSCIKITPTSEMGDDGVITSSTTVESYYDATTAGSAIDAESLEIVTSEAAAGIEKTWACTGLPDTGALPTESIAYTCARFLPKLGQGLAAEDLRFDMEVTPQLGYYTVDDSNAVAIAWVAPSEDGYTWAGAAQVATVAGAAVLATLAF